MSGDDSNGSGGHLSGHLGDDFFCDEHIDYDQLITASMHWLIRRVLRGVMKHGLPGEHHLYIRFDTSDSRVSIPDVLRQRYPDEMTIVLQNRFYDLSAGEEDFSVSLSFSRVLHRLTIPYSALTQFYDPSCGFVLQLGQWSEESQDIDQPEQVAEQDHLFTERSAHEPEEPVVASLAPAESPTESSAESLTEVATRASDAKPSDHQDKSTDQDDSKIVILDQFRKK